jgi:ribosomal protein S18 acetylase RimI-like enzyme
MTSGGTIMQYRAAQPEDEAFVRMLFVEQAAGLLTAAGLGEEQSMALAEMQYRGRQVSWAARYPRAENLIVCDGAGHPVGRLLLHRLPQQWRIVDLVIRPDLRQQGLGEQVLADCQRQATEARVALALQVVPYNPARRLYERMHFCAVHEDAVEVEMIWNAAGEHAALAAVENGKG